MKIERLSKTKATVRSIKTGECFRVENEEGAYMKTDLYDGHAEEMTCIDIESGIGVQFTLDCYVEPITAKVVIE